MNADMESIVSDAGILEQAEQAIVAVAPVTTKKVPFRKGMQILKNSNPCIAPVEDDFIPASEQLGNNVSLLCKIHEQIEHIDEIIANATLVGKSSLYIQKLELYFYRKMTKDVSRQALLITILLLRIYHHL